LDSGSYLASSILVFSDDPIGYTDFAPFGVAVKKFGSPRGADR